MGTVIEFRCPLSEFGLESVIGATGDGGVTIERPVSAPNGQVLLRIRNGEQRALTEALLDEPSVGSVEPLGGSGADHLYLVERDDGFAERLAPFAERGGVVETMWGCADGWHVPTLFPTREAVRETYDHLVECGRAPGIERIYDLSERERVSPVPADA